MTDKQKRELERLMNILSDSGSEWSNTTLQGMILALEVLDIDFDVDESDKWIIGKNPQYDNTHYSRATAFKWAEEHWNVKD